MIGFQGVVVRYELMKEQTQVLKYGKEECVVNLNGGMGKTKMTTKKDMTKRQDMNKTYWPGRK